MHALRVGVIRGGAGGEYDTSLSAGAFALANLPSDQYESRDIFIDKKGVWHHRGIPVSPGDILPKLDSVVSTVSGAAGEDGSLSRILGQFGMPHTLSSPAASAVSFNKLLTRSVLASEFKRLSIKVPIGVSFNREELTPRYLSTLHTRLFLPLIIKPVRGGGSIGASYVGGFHGIPTAAEHALSFDDRAIAEQCIHGKEVVCTVINGFRDESLYALPPVEVRERDQPFLGSRARRDKEYSIQAPSSLTTRERDTVLAASRAAHKTLGLKTASSSEFIVSPRGIYFLEIDSVPLLHEHSPLLKALQVVGATVKDYLQHIIAYSRKARF